MKVERGEEVGEAASRKTGKLWGCLVYEPSWGREVRPAAPLRLEGPRPKLSLAM